MARCTSAAKRRETFALLPRLRMRSTVTAMLITAIVRMKTVMALLGHHISFQMCLRSNIADLGSLVISA
jgi:hypothetical protein